MGESYTEFSLARVPRDRPGGRNATSRAGSIGQKWVRITGGTSRSPQTRVLFSPLDGWTTVYVAGRPIGCDLDMECPNLPECGGRNSDRQPGPPRARGASSRAGRAGPLHQ
jgi:hypothetical protein